MHESTPSLRTPVVLAWSGGKDSALALHALQGDERWQIVGFLTTVVQPAGVVSMHRVPVELIREQAAAAGLPLSVAVISEGASNNEYEQSLAAALHPWTECGVATIAFGDLFLDDIRAYREDVTRRLGTASVFPLWGRDTAELAEAFIAAGFRATICCVDGEKLSDRYCGREFDAEFLHDLPAGIDPCGENGEFHTLVTDGPCFARAVSIATGNVVRRGRFWYCDFTCSASGVSPVTA